MTSNECRTVVLTCSDYRFIRPLEDFLTAEGLTGVYDLIAWPGGGAALLTQDRSSIEEALSLLIQLHGADSVILVVHEDCGRVGEFSIKVDSDEAESISEILGSASDLVAQLLPGVRSRRIRLMNGGAEEV